MDLINIEIKYVEEELAYIYTLRKNKRNHEKIKLLNQRHQDLIFRLQMSQLDNDTSMPENDASTPEKDASTSENNATAPVINTAPFHDVQKKNEQFTRDNFEGLVKFENVTMPEDVRVKDEDVKD